MKTRKDKFTLKGFISGKFWNSDGDGARELQRIHKEIDRVYRPRPASAKPNKYKRRGGWRMLYTYKRVKRKGARWFGRRGNFVYRKFH